MSKVIKFPKLNSNPVTFDLMDHVDNMICYARESVGKDNFQMFLDYVLEQDMSWAVRDIETVSEHIAYFRKIMKIN